MIAPAKLLCSLDRGCVGHVIPVSAVRHFDCDSHMGQDICVSDMLSPAMLDHSSPRLTYLPIEP